MAAGRIKGITVEIGGAGSGSEVPLDGNTTQLQTALVGDIRSDQK